MLSAHGSLPNPVFQPYESGLQDVPCNHGAATQQHCVVLQLAA